MQLTMLIIYASLAIGVSFLCSLLEAVLLSMSHSHVSILEKSGSKSGAIWSNLKNDDAVKPLTAILTLNTIAHTMGAAGVGAEVQSVWDESWLTLASIILTIAVLIFSEIIPKTLGSVYWKQLATPSGWVLHYLTKFLSPLRIPILWAKKRHPQRTRQIVARDELAVHDDMGDAEGTREEAEAAVNRHV